MSTSAAPPFRASPHFGGTTAGFSSFTDSRLRAGFVGGGVEWMFFPNWSLKAEALYYDLGTSRVSGFLQQAVAGGGAIIANTGPVGSWRNNGIIAHAGLNYHLHWFDAAPVVARY